MSTAKLNVWITAIGDPCHMMQERSDEQWYVHIVDCEGKVLTWCGRKYRDIETKCGHVEIDIPPGCYAVFASHTKGGGEGNFGNRLTHVQIVRANCGDHVCVTLFSPTLWYCGTWFADAVRQQTVALRRAGVNEEVARNAIGAVEALLQQGKVDRFTTNTFEALREKPPSRK
jgi:hypothetical protein